ncbi:MAG: type II toxin-antitoxin system PrlF family antitoxin [Burkholderiaceae bacterium]
MSEATLTSKGQVTIPIEIRRRLGVSAQDRITFTPMPDGTVVLRAKSKSIKDLEGMLTPEPGIKVSVDEMSLGIR